MANYFCNDCGKDVDKPVDSPNGWKCPHCGRLYCIRDKSEQEEEYYGSDRYFEDGREAYGGEQC